ncbi:MAG: GNAT family N-acetyltransferase [Neisseria sp.]|nr:GNAT family N-acetyltransferase [Neisseria sp.]
MTTIIFNIDQKRAYALDGETEIGEATFSVSPNLWIIDHTWVNDDYRGQGIAKKLVEKIVEAARQAEVKITATCVYAQKLFLSTSSYDDVVLPEQKTME